MKIFHVIDSAGLYGAEIMLLNLAEEQRKLGHDPVIASIGEKGEYVKPLEAEARLRGTEVVTFRMHNGPNFLGAWRILHYAHTQGFHVLHTHGYKGDILLGFIPRAIRRIPLISTIHGWTNTERISKMRIYEYIDALSLKYMDAVCVVNQTMCNHAHLERLQGRMHYIPNGIPPLQSTTLLPEDEITEFCQEGFTVVSIGRLSREKGYDYLIKAFALFLKSAVDARLLIIGDGPERNKLEGMVHDLGLTGKVLLPGYRREAWRYLFHCQVYVVSSLSEGLPITLLEAMQAEIPIVTTAVGGIPQVLKDRYSGHLVSPSDPLELSLAIHEILHDNLHAQDMASKAKVIVNAEYSSAAMAHNYLNLYRRVTRQV